MIDKTHQHNYGIVHCNTQTFAGKFYLFTAAKEYWIFLLFNIYSNMIERDLECNSCASDFLMELSQSSRNVA